MISMRKGGTLVARIQRVALGSKLEKMGSRIFQTPCVVAGRRWGDLTPNLFYEHSRKMRQTQQSLLKKQAW